MKTKKVYYEDISRGKGGLKYYQYWVLGLHTTLKTKEKIREALNLAVTVYRRDKSNNQMERFNYGTGHFEEV